MLGQKALEQDGLPVLFYKTFWSIVGEAVTNAVKDFFTGGK